MAKATDIRPKITMACAECKHRNYITTKNRRNDPDRIELKKFCPNCGKHTVAPRDPLTARPAGSSSRTACSRSDAGLRRIRSFAVPPSRTWSAGRRSASSPTRSAPPSRLYHDPAAAAALGSPRRGRAADLRRSWWPRAPRTRDRPTRSSAWTTPGWCTATSASPTPGRSSPATGCVCVVHDRGRSRPGRQRLPHHAHRDHHRRRRAGGTRRAGWRRGVSRARARAARCRRRRAGPQTFRVDPGRPGPVRRRLRRLQPDPLERPGRRPGSGLPGVIAHGMFTMALAGRAVTDWAGDPARCVEYGVRFTRPVVVPDDDGAPRSTVTGACPCGGRRTGSPRST